MVAGIQHRVTATTIGVIRSQAVVVEIGAIRTVARRVVVKIDQEDGAVGVGDLEVIFD
jgi:hypothetical protein